MKIAYLAPLVYTIHIMPKVSVLIPAYNRELYLPDAIRSVQEQTYQDWELIIINDASTDNTGTIADTFAVEDSRIRVIHHEENKLRSGALNSGIDAATGEYICFLDSDDIYLPDKLERQVTFLEDNQGVDGTYGDYEVINQDGATRYPTITAILQTEQILPRLQKAAEEGFSPIMPHEEGWIPSCSVLIRKRVFESGIRFDTNLRNQEDFDMWLQILGAGFTLVRLAGNTYKYRRHDDQKSSNPERMRIAGEVIKEKVAKGVYLRD